MTPLTLSLPVPPALVEAIAQRAAQLVLERLGERPKGESPYLTIPEAAAYARCKRQRIDDLLSSRRLTRYKDGRRTLILKAELEARLQGDACP
jgi:excisionase family DNA binding protein